MSSVISTGSTGGGGGGGIDFLTMANLTQVGPDGGGEVFIFGDDGVSVDNTAPNTITISGNSPSYILQTLDGVATPIYTVTVAALSSVVVTATIIGSSADFSTSLYGIVTYGIGRAAGAAYALGVANPNFSTNSIAGAQINATINGNDLEVLVTGEAATEWNWTVTINQIIQS